MKYDIVQAENYEELVKMVQKLIDHDWKPQGGVSTSVWFYGHESFYYYLQAMTLED